MPKLSADQIIKNLVRDYPVDALEFFKPEITQKYGRPVKIDFNIQEIKKHSHYDRNMKNDIAVTYTFRDNRRIVLVLVEHWSDKSKFDIFRFAHYLIDLAKRFPGIEVLPVALFTDEPAKWLKQPEPEIRIRCLDETYLYFRYDLIRMKDHEAKKYIETKNKFIAVLRSAMRYELEQKIALAVEFIKTYRYIEQDIQNFEKNMDAIEFFLEITVYDKERILEEIEEGRDSNMIVQELKKRGFQEGKLEGKLEGILEGKRETALALLKKKMSIKEIAEITGLTVKEIEELKH